VRIVLDAQELKEHPLRIGLSMDVRVDISDTSGPMVASSVRNTPLPVQRSDADDPQVEADIERIIRDNSGSDAGGGTRVSRRSGDDAPARRVAHGARSAYGGGLAMALSLDSRGSRAGKGNRAGDRDGDRSKLLLATVP
jgi:membrane fusion protein (multidrug efflux system)